MKLWDNFFFLWMELFHILLCEEIIYPLTKEKMMNSYLINNFSLGQWKYHFFAQKDVRNEEISSCNFSIYLLKNHCIFKKKRKKNPWGNKCAFPLKWRIFLMQKYPFIPARNFSFICSKILYKDFPMKPRVRRFFSKMFEDFLQNT